MIISTAMATVANIDEAVGRRGRRCKDLILLKCTSTYPAAASDTNLLTSPHMRACSVRGRAVGSHIRYRGSVQALRSCDRDREALPTLERAVPRRCRFSGSMEKT